MSNETAHHQAQDQRLPPVTKTCPSCLTSFVGSHTRCPACRWTMVDRGRQQSLLWRATVAGTGADWSGPRQQGRDLVSAAFRALLVVPVGVAAIGTVMTTGSTLASPPDWVGVGLGLFYTVIGAGLALWWISVLKARGCPECGWAGSPIKERAVPATPTVGRRAVPVVGAATDEQPAPRLTCRKCGATWESGARSG